LQLTLSPGATSATITVTPVDDALTEPSEGVTLTLTAGTGYTVGTPAAASGTIADNDLPAVVSIAGTDTNGAEQGLNPIVFTVTRTVTPNTQIVVNLAWSGAATFGTDYTVTVAGGTLSANGLQLTLLSGATTATITVTPVDDALQESSEAVTLTIGSGTGYTVGTPAAATGTIADNDAPPSVSIAATDASGAEAGLDPIVFTVNRSGNPNTQIVVNMAWSGVAAFGTDYTVSVTGGTLSADRLQLTLASGATSAIITLTPVDNTTIEPSESVTVTLTSGTGYTVGTPSAATGTIADNDVPTLTISNASVTEGNNGTKTVAVTVTLSAAAATTVTVGYATANGTATAGSDYQATSGTLTFTAGVTSRTFNITINGDRVVEPNETILVTLSNPVGATIATGTATVTILNDENALTASDAPIGEGGSVTELTSSQLDVVVEQAKAAWLANNPEADLSGLSFSVAHLDELMLGNTSGLEITIDATAAGFGWSFDTRGANGRMDLFTVVMHEIGHALGYEHDVNDLMEATLSAGERKLETVRPSRSPLDWLPVGSKNEGLRNDSSVSFFRTGDATTDSLDSREGLDAYGFRKKRLAWRARNR
jgi:hypothetical protein